MLCLKPNPQGFACGGCVNCRINNQRIWACRLLLEAYFHRHASFVTLTYDDAFIQTTEDGLGNLVPRHLKNFLRKIKYHLPHVRYFGVGEYGEKTERPHYHAVLFGASIEDEPTIALCWKKGFHQVSELTFDRAQYVAQYTIKKMTKSSSGLKSRHPEFIRTSREKFIGGIGAPACGWLANMHRTRAGRKELSEKGDVWKTVRIDGRIWPLGPYLRARIRNRLGIPQLAEERAIMFDMYNPETGEIFAPGPLPETYCPTTDVTDVPAPKRIQAYEEARKELQPDLEASAAKRARSRRRRNQTIKV